MKNNNIENQDENISVTALFSKEDIDEINKATRQPEIIKDALDLEYETICGYCGTEFKYYYNNIIFNEPKNLMDSMGDETLEEIKSLMGALSGLVKEEVNPTVVCPRCKKYIKHIIKTSNMFPQSPFMGLGG